MEVKIIGMSSCYGNDIQNVTDIIYTALSQCYNESFTFDDAKKTSDKKKEAVIKSVVKSGHDSVLEHVSITFLVQNCSRVLTHQLVRHRIASYTQRSARYTKINTDNNDWYVVPKSINTQERLDVYNETMKSAASGYNKLIELGVPMEDARYVIGDGQCTNIVVTMNLRALKHFFGERCCTRAQKEIRDLAHAMADECAKVFPLYFDEDFRMWSTKCVQRGFCTEHKSCGLMPKLESLLQHDD